MSFQSTMAGQGWVDIPGHVQNPKASEDSLWLPVAVQARGAEVLPPQLHWTQPTPPVSWMPPLWD